MTKKTTVTVPAKKTVPVVTLSKAIAADIKANLNANKSGSEVAAAFDKQFGALEWTKLKGNSSAKTCNMSAAEFKLVRDARIEYRDAWKKADLPNFDSRWQYVKSLSKHTPKVEDQDDGAGEGEGDDDSGSTKTKAEQCIAALQNALRYATHEDFDGDIKTAEKIRAALKANGIVEDAE